MSSAAVGNTMNPLVAHAMASMLRHRTEEMTNNLFDRMDADGKGSIDKAEMLKTFSTLEGSTPEKDQKTVDDAFKVFDGDDDGKITKDEMKSGLLRIADALDEQYNQSRMAAATAQTTSLLPKPDATTKPDDLSVKEHSKQNKLQAYLDADASTKSTVTVSA